ncbi:carbohydrate ABC transporter permease [Breznakiella homolactica]|uniref:Maltose/maltodextrin transport system permease protein MalG n=1 Tax=Breznakiella homolactica TaxID=2798577 RepID=A0A7T7XQQ3_9SPIR|nr:carbohydrate ABC transporter permease [Breznakiella homolactica]QQO10687.1 carbohydrate ABC transporter permease [Breznakiella homolactica]
MKIRKLGNGVFNLAVSLVLVSIIVLPLLWMISLSFKNQSDILAWPPKFIFRPTMENYQAIFGSKSTQHLPFLRVLTNSLIVTACSLTVSLTLSALAAYSLGRLKPKGKTGINYLILGLRMIPPIAIVVPLFIIWNRIGLYDTRLGLIIPFIALDIPLSTWLLQGFFESIPGNLEDAAVIDGCTRFQAFYKIILPLAAPGIAATSIFSFSLSWNNLTLPLPLTLTKAATMPVLASQVRTDEGILWGQLGAYSTLMIVPMVLFTIFAANYLIGGISSGAVKE